MPDSRIDVVTAFWMATAGGADLVGSPVGILQEGRRFDAVAVDLDELGIWAEVDDHARIFEKIVRRTTPAAIRTVWVDGVEVSPVRTGASDRGSD